MNKNLDLILRRAADFQKLTDPHDALSRMVRETTEEGELFEDQLDYIAAARNSHLLSQGTDRHDKENPFRKK